MVGTLGKLYTCQKYGWAARANTWTYGNVFLEPGAKEWRSLIMTQTTPSHKEKESTKGAEID